MRFAGAFACVALLLASACAFAPTRRATTSPIARQALRIGELASEGDARRRASTQLVLDGLASEQRGSPRDALARYEDALKIDANNPYAALAFARYEIFAGDADRGLAYLDRYETLAGAAAAAEHVAGLRGAALARLGKPALASPYLEEARSLAPNAWGDARLDARELR